MHYISHGTDCNGNRAATLSVLWQTPQPRLGLWR